MMDLAYNENAVRTYERTAIFYRRPAMKSQ